MDWNEERRLIKVAKMYYEQNFTQNEIANRLGIYRTTITRLLQKARDKNIVQITIKGDYTEQVTLESELAENFQLKDAIVVPAFENQTSEERKQALGSAAVNLLNSIIKDKDVIGFAWGSTLGSMVNLLERYKKRNVDFVPLVGGPGKMPVDHHVNTIVYNHAKAYDGRAHFIDAAAIVPSVQNKTETIESAYFQDILELWNKLTIAFVGIGAHLSSSNLIFSGFLGDKDVEGMKQLNPVGDICSRFYNISGEPIHGDIDERTIAIELSKLKNTNYTIGVAESTEKTDSIIGALRGGYISHLITNDITARAVLDQVKMEGNH
ncbi:sugar-binding transcriptional regulator [Salibacterium salarium]|uniref:Sugar-binding transcriptional regulator n=1 Tax=Salibacterium salarium TaxID=284579 RepID=A0A428MVN6_9BACI|nr:sugar-binding transcriptional regulator [Salibacterium salarium]RSL30119.1 sugar-binding transcriptional regulator [Salibacterium salarium]